MTSTIGRLAAVVVFAGLVAAGCGTADEQSSSTDEPDSTEADSNVEGDSDEVDDVTIASCTEDAAGMVANLTVTNNSSKRSTYSIDVTMEGPDGSQLATALAFVDNLEAGQTAQTTAHSLTPASAGFTCRVVQVDRMASA